MSGLVEAPFIPSPIEVVEKALDLACITSGDVLYDLGAGDGRVVLEAARRGAYSVAVEIDPYLVEVIKEKAMEAGLSSRVCVVEASYYDVYLGYATVVYAYLYRYILEKLRSKFEKELLVGTRVLTLDFPVTNWIPVRVKRVVDNKGIVRTIYLYIIGYSNPGSLYRRTRIYDYRRLLGRIGSCRGG